MAIRAYPDPDSVAITSTLPPRFGCRITTMGAVNSHVYPIHRHGAFVDARGNGNTDANDSHFHYVRNGKVIPDPIDGHTHELTYLPCGAD